MIFRSLFWDSMTLVLPVKGAPSLLGATGRGSSCGVSVLMGYRLGWALNATAPAGCSSGESLTGCSGMCWGPPVAPL